MLEVAGTGVRVPGAMEEVALPPGCAGIFAGEPLERIPLMLYSLFWQSCLHPGRAPFA